MLRSVIRCLAGAALLSSCTNSVIRSQEGHACSTNPDDDPQLVCTPAQDFVCIATYTKVVTNPQEAAKFDGGLRSVYVCRLNCNTTDECPQRGDMDVCCPGHIHGKTYGKMGGCVPLGSCDTLRTDDAAAPTDAPPRKLDGSALVPDTGGAAVDAPVPDAAAPAPDAAAPAPDAPAPTPDVTAPAPDAGAGID